MTTGHGGPDRLVLKVGACGCNNTDIDTRTAWYSEIVRSGITAEGGSKGFDPIVPEAATWGDGITTAACAHSAASTPSS